MKNLQDLAKRLTDPENSQDIQKYYQAKKPYYEYWMNLMLDPNYYKDHPRVRIKDCPNHPTNPNSPDFDPNHADTVWVPETN